MHFLLNASPHKLLDVATLQVHRSHDVEGTGQHFYDPKVKAFSCKCISF